MYLCMQSCTSVYVQASFYVHAHASMSVFVEPTSVCVKVCTQEQYVGISAGVRVCVQVCIPCMLS